MATEIIMKGIGIPDDPANFSFSCSEETTKILSVSLDASYFIFENRFHCDKDEDVASRERQARRESIHFWLQQGAAVKELYRLNTGE